MKSKEYIELYETIIRYAELQQKINKSVERRLRILKEELDKMMKDV